MKPKQNSQAKNAGRSSNSRSKSNANSASPKILAIDIGGTNVKVLASGMKEPIKIPSGPTMTPALMVKQVKDALKDLDYEVVSIGYPAPVVHGRPLREPHNLAPGWVGFNFRRAFGRPVKIINDAAMQALGSYKKGRMLFLGLGTGLGSAMISDYVLEPMELAHLPYKTPPCSFGFFGERSTFYSPKRKGTKKRGLGKEWVRRGGFDPPRVPPPDPKSGASANSATFALWAAFTL